MTIYLGLVSKICCHCLYYYQNCSVLFSALLASRVGRIMHDVPPTSSVIYIYIYIYIFRRRRRRLDDIQDPRASMVRLIALTVTRASEAGQCWQASQSALEFCPIHCPNGRLGQDLGFGRFAFALKLPELLNRNLAAVRAKLGQRSCFPNGPRIWCPIGQ